METVPARARAAQGCGRLGRNYRQFWEQSFDRLDDYLAELKSAHLKPKEKKHVREYSKQPKK
jgi:hypothetical protein